MFTVEWLAKFRALMPTRVRIVPDGVLARDEFRRLISRERNRADRVGSQLSLLLLDLSRTGGEKAHLAASLTEICRRMRETDAVGWFQRRCLGILLPETAFAGAQRVLEDLRARIHPHGLDASWRLYTYPGQALPQPQTGRRDDDPDARPPQDGGERPEPREGDATTERTPRVAASARPAAKHPEHVLRIVGSSAVVPQASLLPLLLPRRSRMARALDVLLASLCLLLFAPVILVAGLLVKLTSPGPMFFRQTRLGQGGRPFQFLKLRTMCVDAEARKKDLLALNEQSGPVFKVTRDPRVTPVGRVLRKLSIDELPQLWNVLVGDMTFVGPRPPLPDEVAEYEPWQRRRLDIAGGLTCIWQVSGRSQVQFEDWVRMDLRYARDASPWLDLKILAQTIPAVVTGKGAR